MPVKQKWLFILLRECDGIKKNCYMSKRNIIYCIIVDLFINICNIGLSRNFISFGAKQSIIVNLKFFLEKGVLIFVSYHCYQASVTLLFSFCFSLCNHWIIFYILLSCFINLHQMEEGKKKELQWRDICHFSMNAKFSIRFSNSKEFLCNELF